MGVQRRAAMSAGAGAVGSALAAVAGAAAAEPALPELGWRCTSSFPRSLDTIFAGAEVFARTLGALTQGRFRVTVHPAGEVAPGLAALDAASDGVVELCHTCSYYFTAKDPTFAFGTGLPFGLNARLQNAWLAAGGGNELLNDFYRGFGVVGLPAGNTGAQMGGWFREEVRSAADLRGLKMRVAGIAGQVLGRLGVVPEQIAGGEIEPALARGAIDAAEWVGPYDDEKLGLHKVARFYYYPGWWEPGTTVHLFVNAAAWAGLPDLYREACAAAAAHANAFMQAKYDVQNPAALKRLVAAGVELRAFPADVMEAASAAAAALYGELAAGNPAFRDVYEHWSAFRDDGYLWWLVDEIAMDAFMVRQRAGRRAAP